MWSNWTKATTNAAKEVASKATSSLQQQKTPEDPSRPSNSSNTNRSGSANRSLLDEDIDTNLTPAEIQERLAKCRVIEANFQGIIIIFKYF
jgi:hypothetical protein